MVVVSVTDEEARRLEPDNSASANSMDYYERRSVPVTVPSTQKLVDEATGKEYVVYNIYMAGRQVTTRRYREFDALSNNVSEGVHYKRGTPLIKVFVYFDLSSNGSFLISYFPSCLGNDLLPSAMLRLTLDGVD